MMTIACRLLCLLVLPLATQAVIQIDKSDGGYGNIVVAIHPSIAPDERIITNTKALFSNASDLLHRATNGRVFFKQVTISIPSTWPQRSGAERVNSDLFEHSHIRVDKPNPYYGSVPYTYQPRRCGEPGEYIHLTADFLLHTASSEDRSRVSPGYELLQQWAHFRYGIFEDYGIQGDSMYPIFYCINDKVRANTFPSNVPFYPETSSGTTCTIYRNCKVSKECIAALGQHNDTVSVMYMPKTGADVPHDDTFTPSKQNVICKRKSTLEVIERNSGFNGLPEPRLDKVTTVKFREVQQSRQDTERAVLVLDVSRSMDEFDRMDYLKRSATYFVKNLAPDSLQLGIVTFSQSAAILQNLVTVDSKTRQGLLDLIGNLTTDSTTAIGQGLETAMKVLREDGGSPEAASIILMTDGEENIEPYIADVLPSLIDAKVRVNGLGLGAEADEKLETVADFTGGRVFFVKDRQANIEIAMESAFEESATGHLGESHKPITVLEQSVQFTNNSIMSFMMDDDLGNETQVTIVSDSLEEMEVALLDPSGKPCSSCENRTDIALSKRMTITISTRPKHGKWTLVTSCDSTDPVHMNVRVLSKAESTQEEPIRVRAFLNRAIVERAEDSRIYAEVTKGKNAVARARVQAQVTRPNDDADVELDLWDNGLGADVTADDGIYSSYFTQFNGRGRYSVVIRAENGGSALQLEGRKASGAVPPPTKPDARNLQSTASEFPRSAFVFVDADLEEVEDVHGRRLPEFQRFSNGGAFRLGNDIKATTIPPNAIQDLAVAGEKDRSDGYAVTLSWTCPGAHFDNGQASHIEIRTSDNLTSFLHDFNSGMYGASAAMLPAGGRQEVTIVLLKKRLQYSKRSSVHVTHIAARVWNDDGLASDVSNFVVVHYQPTLLTLADFTTTHWTAFLAPCFVFVFLVIAVLVLSCRKRRPETTALPLSKRRDKLFAEESNT